MPLYEFEKVQDPEQHDSFFFSMAEAPKIGEVIKDDDGVEWKRVITKPYASVDSQIDPNNPNDFVEKTGKKKGTYGDILDASKELSEKRAKQHGGEDPVQRRFFDDYKAKRHGVEHLEEKRKKKVEKEGFTITYN
jgi:hypothetical protein